VTITIQPIKVADVIGIPDSVRRYGVGQCASVADMPVYTFVVERPGHGLVLFDTGCAPPSQASANGHPQVDPASYRTAAQALGDAGIDPADVATVVLSHLHWDHCYGLTAFPGAEILVQRRELQGAFAPYPEYQTIYESFELGLRPAWLDVVDRMRPLDGWADLGDGVAVVPLPGHTDGSQGLVVQTAHATWCCVGDLLADYANWTGLYRPNGHPTGVIPNGLHSDLVAWRRSVEEIARNRWVPLPAHDDGVTAVISGHYRPRHGDAATLD